MKNIIKNSFAILLLCPAITQAASLTVSSSVVHNGEEVGGLAVDLSMLTVTGSVGSTSLGTTLSDYVFLSNDAGRSDTQPIVVAPSASGGTRIGDITAAANTIAASNGSENRYSVTIDGVNLVSGAPIAGATGNDFEAGVMASDLSGTIDLSGLASGTIHLIYGTFISAVEVTANLNDGSADLLSDDLSGGVFGNSNFTGSSGHVLTSFDFDTSGGFDTFSWSQINADTDGSRGRFSGVVITDVVLIPEPSTALLGLFGLAVFARRRR